MSCFIIIQSHSVPLLFSSEKWFWLYAIQFEDYRDAEDAIRGRDGYDFDGHRLRVSYPSILVH